MWDCETRALARMNIARWLERAALTQPALPAVAVGDRVVAHYGRLARRAAGFAASLAQRFALEPGDRVAIVAKNCPDYLDALFGAWWGGYAAVPVNAKLHPSEIDFILAHSGASVAIVSPGLDAGLGREQHSKRCEIVVMGSADYE